MSHKPLFILYQKEFATHRFRIAPVNGLGSLVFLLNLGGMLFGLFEMLGMNSHIPQWLGGVIFFANIAFFIFSLVFLTDYSRPGDGS